MYDAIGTWGELSTVEQLLHSGSLCFLIGFLLLYFTRFGERWLAYQCLLLAFLLHGLGYGYTEIYVPPANMESASYLRVPIELHPQERETHRQRFEAIYESRSAAVDVSESLQPRLEDPVRTGARRPDLEPSQFEPEMPEPVLIEPIEMDPSEALALRSQTPRSTSETPFDDPQESIAKAEDRSIPMPSEEQERLFREEPPFSRILEPPVLVGEPIMPRPELASEEHFSVLPEIVRQETSQRAEVRFAPTEVPEQPPARAQLASILDLLETQASFDRRRRPNEPQPHRRISRPVRSDPSPVSIHETPLARMDPRWIVPIEPSRTDRKNSSVGNLNAGMGPARKPSEPSTDPKRGRPGNSRGRSMTFPLRDLAIPVPSRVSPVEDATAVARRGSSSLEEETFSSRRSGISGTASGASVPRRFERSTTNLGGREELQYILAHSSKGSETIEIGREDESNLRQAPSIWRLRSAPNRLDIVLRRGGSLRTEQAVADALAWLAKHQEPSGFWDSDGFGHHCPPGEICSGPARETGSDTGLTGLALLAFLGADHTHLKRGQYQETVRRGLSWLIQMQASDGDLRGRGRVYCHTMAALALADAYGLTGDTRLRAPAQKAVNWLVLAQDPRTAGWRYVPREFGDTSVFGWVVMVMYSAREAGLEVPDRTWSRMPSWLSVVSSGQSQGMVAYRPGYKPSPAMTAEALFCRELFALARGEDDRKFRDDPTMKEAGQFVLSNLPVPEQDLTNHLYYWYYGTLSMAKLGGEYWELWNESLSRTLLQAQSMSGHQHGSWRPAERFGRAGGRIFTTACSALCLEVYYRYAGTDRRR